MKKFLKNIQVLSLVGVVAALSSCGCPEFNTEPNPDPSVLEATITEFNPDFTVPSGVGSDTVAVPVPQYSVITFAFPITSNIAGILYADPRIDQKQNFVLNEERFQHSDNKFYTAQLLTSRPPNDSLVGDLLISQVINVDAIDFTQRSAKIRLAGIVGIYNRPWPGSASSEEFANYLKTDAVKQQSERFHQGNGVSPHGEALPNFSIVSDIGTARVVDDNGNEVSIPVPADIQQRFSEITAGELEVRIGEVYFYRATNGIEFAVLIEDILKGSQSPNKRQVKIQFAVLRGPSCEP